jgi:hypothetical protein
MLSMLAENRTRLLAYHFAWPGIGHVAKQGGGSGTLRKEWRSNSGSLFSYE